MAAEDVDPIYQYIDRKFEELKTELLLDQSDSELGLETQVLRLRRVLVQTRKELAETYMQFTLHLRFEMDEAEAVQRVGEELGNPSIWFQGALQETSNPEAVYDRWFSMTWDILEVEGLEDSLSVGANIPPVAEPDS